MGGDNSSKNVVLLTAKEHYVCHHLLYEFCRGYDKLQMAVAWRRMSTDFRNDKQRYVNSNSFAIAKKHASLAISEMNSGPNDVLRNTLRNKSVKKQKLVFVNVNTGDKLVGDKFQLMDYDSNLSHHEVDIISNNHHRCCKCWMVQTGDKTPKRWSGTGKNSPSADMNVYTFELNTGETFTGTRGEFVEVYPELNCTTQGLCDIIKKRQHTHRGVSVKGVKTC